MSPSRPSRAALSARLCPARAERAGFALLVTITLVAFLVLVLVSLATLTRVETAVADNSQQMDRARQNALMALKIAVGELQKRSGPDQRVTASADVIIPAAVSVTPATAADAAINSLDTYWNGGRNRHWMGVWENGNTTSFNPDVPISFNASPQLLSWLVSGNEGGIAYNPTDVVSGLGVSSTPLDEIKDDAGRSYRLLVKASAGVSASTGLGGAVVAPQVEVKAGDIPGTSGASVPVGHYAWWIGDEGIKARANIVDSYSSSGDVESGRTRLQSAQRPAIEAMSVSGADGLAAGYPANNEKLTGTFTPAQLRYLEPSPTFATELAARFHDLSFASRGVLSDARHGGLKRDLSYLLAQPDIGSLRTALQAAYGDAAVAPSAAYNTLLSTVATPYAALPVDASGGTYPYNGSPGILSYGATWEQLWSFANMGNTTGVMPAGVFDSEGRVVPRLATATQEGISPLVVQCKVFYRLRIVGGVANADGVNRAGVIWVDTIPLVVLANPYAVALAPTDYSIKIGGVRPTLEYGTTDSTNHNDFDAAPGYTNPGSYMADIEFVLRSQVIGPGEARIFTIDPDPLVNPGMVADRFELSSSSDNRKIVMKNDYDPVPALTYNTAQSIPAAYSRVALQSGPPQITTRLYLNYVAADGDKGMLQLVRGGVFTDGGSMSKFLIVNATADGVRQGGGYIMVMNQPPTNTTPASLVPQQAVFYQVNYRATLLFWSGNSAITPHPLEWAPTFGKSGDTGGLGNTPNSFIEANLMRPSGGTETTRWGVANIGEGPTQTTPPDSIGGASGAGQTGFDIRLYDLPRPGRPLASLGQLQHFNTAGFVPGKNFLSGGAQYPCMANNWQVNYPMGNSYAHPRIPRDRLFHYTAATGYHFDGSYLWNDLLWDRFYFSSYPQSEPFDFATDRLVNARYRPFREPSDVPRNEPAKFRGDGDPANAANSRMAAENLLVDGAFNVNSTSVEAWKAVLSSLKNVPVGNEALPGNLTAPFVRTLHQELGTADATKGNNANSWAGGVNLTVAQIDSLAREIVMQVRKRGPFLSMSDFVNRRLISGADSFKLGLKGCLQAAIDNVINRKDDVAAPFNVTAQSTAPANTLADTAYTMSTGMSGFPGYLLQGDVLSAIGSTLAVRSDTFTVRTYGDSVNPLTGDVLSRAWCEATVQRLPDYVVPRVGATGDEAHDDATHPDNIAFGRRYVVVGFRWLEPGEL